MAEASHRAIKDFAGKRTRLIALINEVGEVLRDLGDHDAAAELAVTRRTLEAERFRVLVLAEMKRGKSTLVNALLGEPLLPSAGIEPCTAVPITVSFGEERRGVCQRRPPEGADEFDLVKDREEFERAVRISPERLGLRADEFAAAEAAHPYVRADVRVPADICRHGVELQDTPGLNEDEARTRATWSEVPESDAVILVFSCHEMLKATERGHLQRTLELGKHPRVVFVVWNRFDELRSGPDALERVLTRSRVVLAPFGIHEDHVSVIAAREALDGRLRADTGTLGASRIGDLESKLGTFLLNERAASKLLAPLDDAERRVNWALSELAAGRFARASAHAEKWRAALSQAQPRLEGVRTARVRANARAQRSAERLASLIQEAVREFLERLRDGVPAQVALVHVSNEDAVFDARAARERVVSHVKAWARAEIAVWEREQLRGLVDKEADVVRLDAVDEVDALRSAYAEVVRLLKETTREGGPESREVAQRAMPDSLDVAPTMHDIGEALQQSSSGISMGSGVGVLLTVGGVLGAWLGLVLTAGVLIAPLAIVGAVVLAIIGGLSASERFKSRAAEAMQGALTRNLPAAQAKCGSEMLSKFTSAVGVVDTQLQSLLAAVEHAVGAIRRGHEEAERLARTERERLDRASARLRRVAGELASLRREVDPAENPEVLAARLAAGWRGSAASRVESAVAVERDSGLAELEAKFDDEERGRLNMAERVLKERRKWSPTTRRLVLVAWSKFKKTAQDAPKQQPVYRTATVMAVGEGLTSLPTVKEVRAWWSAETTRAILMELFEAITGEPHPCAILDSNEAKKAAIENSLKAYERARDFVDPPGGPDGPVRRGTAVHTTEEREHPEW